MEPRTSNEGSSTGHSKTENAMDVDRLGRAGGGRSGGGGGGNVDWLYRKSLPEFLRKTYEMVENPETNNLISWSATGKSLVIGNRHQFAKDLLPKHFRHNNFSSFNNQLNNYGFKKISSVPDEYENPFFQKDSKHLLHNIKKRPLQPKNDDFDAPRKRAKESSSSQHFEADGSHETEIEKLKNNFNTMDLVLWELKQREVTANQRLAAIEKRIEDDIKQEVFTFMTNAIDNPSFVQNFFKLVAHNSAGESLKHLDLNVESSEEVKTDVFEITSVPNLKCDEESISMAKKLLEEDDLVWESGAEDQMGQCQSRIVMELEDLIATKPSGRVDIEFAEYARELMQESGLP